jgi:hypothetical protein
MIFLSHSRVRNPEHDPVASGSVGSCGPVSSADEVGSKQNGGARDHIDTVGGVPTSFPGFGAIKADCGTIISIRRVSQQAAVISICSSVISRVVQSDIMPKLVNLDTHSKRIRTSEGGRLTWEVGPRRRSAPVCCVGDDIHNLSEAVEVDWGGLGLEDFLSFGFHPILDCTRSITRDVVRDRHPQDTVFKPYTLVDIGRARLLRRAARGYVTQFSSGAA